MSPRSKHGGVHPDPHFPATIKVIRASLVLLRTICRGNEEVQTELFEHIGDFLEMQVAIPEMANLLTMVRARIRARVRKHKRAEF